ncbi:dTDP-glucose 4,6-dehydratase [Leptospira kobayashii]|uniref:dTDP-glucose 4,6-dehydratase n=1 Tax=Leptospira kobayashii TaxID=1917830 RepID=A0ABM7UJW6_9LEPT|nr:NAD(P)-dependent oxidoreductase [Leptospira kobayashii]BDA79169.1 dTDP-glucose 4,6-dehydratase [Leptospira kobayashii]
MKIEDSFPVEDLDFVLSHTDFQKLKNEKIFLTGGTGFIGRWFLESFLHANRVLNLDARLTVLSRDPESFLRKYPKYKSQNQIDFRKGDVLEFPALEKDFTVFIHAAAESDSRLDSENALATSQIIVQGTKNVLDFAVDCNAKYFLYLSSGAVYGSLIDPHITEKYAGAPLIDPKFTYGESKRYAELLCRIYAGKSKIKISIARCFAFVGPGLPLNSAFAIGNFINNILEQTKIQIQGDGTPFRSYMYPSDLMIWLWTILFHSDSSEIYNVGSDVGISILDLAKEISDMEGLSDNVVVHKEKNPNAPISYYVPSVQKAKEELALKIRINLHESIRKTIRFHRGTK